MAVMFLLTANFTFSGNENDHSTSLNFEKAEFSNAGYWIDAVVVTTNAEIGDEELLAGKGYYIGPVVVTYDADKALLADQGYYIEPVIVTAQTGAPLHEYAAK